MPRLLLLSMREWQHHPWRHGAALLAVMLGVALAWSVHVINTSALNEFSAAVRSANGQPDATLRGPADGIDDAALDRVAADPAVSWVTPVVEVETYARSDVASGRWPVRIVGVDILSVAPLAPDLMPRPYADVADRLAGLDPRRVFANAAARQKLGTGPAATQDLQLQSGSAWKPFVVSGDVAAQGAPLLVMDIAAVQAQFGKLGRITRMDIRLQPGATTETLAPLLQSLQTLSPGLYLARAEDAEQRVSNLSRAYRVNLTVLALVALLVGSFLVYSVTALSVAQRAPQWALLGILGLTARERRAVVLTESAMLGTLGSLLGLLLGGVMAWAALRWLSGDLGGGYFGGSGQRVPDLIWQSWAPWAFGALGLASALIGAWVPARQAQRLRPAQAIKGLGMVNSGGNHPWVALALCAAGSVLAFMPPLAELPLAAYASVAAWLFGGVAAVPWAVAAVLRWLPKPSGALTLLAVERANAQRMTATAAVAGVVASLALCVALTVMVASFRGGVAHWLDAILPADLYARTAQNSGLADNAWLPQNFVDQASAVPGIARVQAGRTRALSLAPGRPTVALVTRELGNNPGETLPFVDTPLPASPGETGVYVSEAMRALYGAEPGSLLTLPLERPLTVRVLGIWRDYARQFGTIAIDANAYRQWTGDTRITDLAIWLAPDADLANVQAQLRAVAPDPDVLDFARTTELRQISLNIFDRSFAVTSYLQVVAIGIGLLGIAASLSAQIMARRKEFGLLAHLGLTRHQVMALVVGETAVWLAAGVLVGLALGAVISLILVHVVNPQSFHWTMDTVWPLGRLSALAAGVLVAGLLTASLCTRQAASRSAVMAVKEDW
jgi:putative ABC transport system permease protein